MRPNKKVKNNISKITASTREDVSVFYSCMPNLLKWDPCYPAYNSIGNFRVHVCLLLKASLSAKFCDLN